MMNEEQKQRFRAAIKSGSVAEIDRVVAELCLPCKVEPSQAPVLRKSGHRKKTRPLTQQEAGDNA